MSNRKISFYLKPAHARADQLADEMLEAMPVKARGNVCRAAMLAGMALMRQDARLPHLIAELFDERTTISQIRHLISSVLPEDSTSLVTALQQLAALAQPSESASTAAPAAITTPPPSDNAARTRQNASNLFPG
ncbi:plasmid stability family protein [Serratia marcescens]|uniref:Plasmid stability family protein n=1 Tax=Serratia marcescens TaxID=615 RepID=A0A5C7CFJ1_SERMA|nr:plasmid partitioning/stability family protein [Serratia marcescens]TXE33236.1 plasmid stability family protein [Serratia marcescens]TXE65240.1 plasmid stability family protein [Serratia marcescens]